MTSVVRLLPLLLALVLPPGRPAAQEAPPPAPPPAETGDPEAGAAAAPDDPAGAAAGAPRVGVEGLAPLDDGLDPVLHVVGEVEIHASDVFVLLDLTAPSVSAEVQRQMVLTAMARLAAQEAQVDVPVAVLEAQVEEAITEQRARFALGVDAEMPLERFLEERFGMDPQAYRAQVRSLALANLLIERVVRLETLRTPRDELQLILVEEEELAREIAAKLAEGASFAVLARKHSVHPGAANGGLMPPLPEAVDLPLVEGRQTLSPGDVLGPAPISLDGQDYWRFVRLVERLPGRSGGWADLSRLVEEDLRARPLHPDEVALFEARAADRYRVRSPARSP